MHIWSYWLVCVLDPVVQAEKREQEKVRRCVLCLFRVLCARCCVCRFHPCTLHPTPLTYSQKDDILFQVVPMNEKVIMY
jgi:hypothetical protein